MDESAENTFFALSGQGSSFNEVGLSAGNQMDDEISSYLSRLSPTSKRRLDEFVQVNDYSMPMPMSMTMGDIVEVDENPIPIPEVNFAIGGQMQYNFGSTPLINFDCGNNSEVPANRGRPLTMYEPFREPDEEFSSLPPDLLTSNHFTVPRKTNWEAEDADYIDTIDESRNFSFYSNHYETIPPVMQNSNGNEILVAADVHRSSEERRYDEIEIYATVKKNKTKKNQEFIMETSANSDLMQKLPNIMTQSCYGELNIPTPEQSGNWTNYNEFLIKSSENLLSMTGTTNSSMIDGTSSMNSSIYEQIPSMNSSFEIAMKNSATKIGNDRNRVKWWDDLTEETATEIQEIANEDLAAIRKILENETGGNVCPSCQMPFDKGKKRKLIDTCGHERCYSCMFRNESCTICKMQKEHPDNDLLSCNGNKKNMLNDYDTGIGSTTTLLSPLGSPQPTCRSHVKTNGHFTTYMQTRNELSSPDLLYSKLKSRPPKCPTSGPQQQPLNQHPQYQTQMGTKASLSHLRGLVDVTPQNSTSNTTVNVCATPPQNRRRFLLPKNFKSPFGMYRNRSHDNNSTLSAFFTKSLSGLSSLNSSISSEPGLMTTSTPVQTPTKQKLKENKENRITRFSAAAVSAGQLPSFVFGKIKSLWSAHTTTSRVGLNFLADQIQGQKVRSTKDKSNAAKGITKHTSISPDDEGGNVKPMMLNSGKSKSSQDELQVRLGFFLENNPRTRTNIRTTHQQSLNSLTSSNTSPVSTLTGSSEADGSRMTLQEQTQQKNNCDSIGSMMSISISEQSNASNASSSPLSRRHSVTNTQHGEDFKGRKQTVRRSVRTAQIKGPIDPKIRFAQYRQQAQLTLKPLFFEVPLQEPDPLFVGRHWLVRELSTIISTNECTGVLLNGNLGTGKTALILQLVEYSCFGRRKDAAIQEHEGIYCQINVANERLRSLASHVVAYHFCQADNNLTCLVPDFIHSLAAQLCQAPQLAAYHEFLLGEPHLQNVLSVKECIADPERALKMGILEPLEALKRQGKIPAKNCLVLIDALCEAEYHRPDHGDTIASFLAKMCHNFPPWLKIIATVRTQMLEFTKGLPYTKMSLDTWMTNEPLQKDILDYIVFRLNHSPSIQNNIGVGGASNSGGNTNGSGTLMLNKDTISYHHQYNKFAQHLLSLSRGSFLYVKLILDLIERGHLVIKSTSYKVLPVSLPQIFLLNFNLRFPTQTAYEKISSILSVCLAALAPLNLYEIFYSVNALFVEQPLEWSEFLNRFKMLSGFLVKRIDNTYMFFHPSFREWLIRRDECESTKFLCDLRTGHAAISLRLSRLEAPLDAEKTLELGHHILKAHIYRNAPPTQSPRDMQAFWVSSVTKCASEALCTLRNAYSPNVKVSRLLLLGGASPNFKTNYLGSAPILCIAAYEGIVPMVSLLLEFGADVELANSQGCTPLILAAMRGHCDVVRQLVAAGSYLGQTDTQQRCALVHAAMAGNLKVVKYLVACDWIRRQESSSDVSLDEAAQQALITAASKGHTSTVEDLLDMPEVNVNAQDCISGETALTSACTNGHTDTVSTLLARGASHNMRNRKDMLPLLLAVKEGHWSIVERLIQNSADLEETDANGKTALMIAAEEGHVGIIDLLLSKGASMTETDKDGLTALSWACLRGKLQAAKCLIERNADRHHEDHHQRTPLDLAAYQGSAALVQMLLDTGAQIEHFDKNGMRPLDRAIACRNVQVVQVFLKRGAKLGPTTWAMATGKSEILLILLNKLLEDGNLLYRKNRLQEAAHRYQYALKKIPSGMENTDSFGDAESHTAANSVTFQQLRFNFYLNLSRCKRKMNETAESIELASSAIELKPNNYDGYYARAKGLLEMGEYDKALIDARTALEKVKLQQKYQHLSNDITETLIRLYDDLTKKCDLSETLTINETDYRQSIDHSRLNYDLNHEITDL